MSSSMIYRYGHIAKYNMLLLSPHEPPAAGRRGEMDEADKQDYEAMEEVDGLCQDPAVGQGFAVEEFDGMCHETARGLQKICDRLPTHKEIQDPASRHDR
jgi:hypothetical protein